MAGKSEGNKGIEYYAQLPHPILVHQIEDEGVKYWMAEIPDLPGCKSHGATVEEAIASVEKAKRDWIADSLDAGESVPVPVDRLRYSGKTLVRMSRSLHRSLALLADSEKLSLNQMIVTILAKEVGRLDVLNRAEDKMDRLLEKIQELVERDQRSDAVMSIVRARVGQTEERRLNVVGTAEPKKSYKASDAPEAQAKTRRRPQPGR